MENGLLLLGRLVLALLLQPLLVRQIDDVRPASGNKDKNLVEAALLWVREGGSVAVLPG